MKLLSFLLLIVSSVSFASEQVQELVEAKEQIKILNEQLNMHREFHASLLSTVHWTLATIVTIGVLLIGYNWFSNFKTYERDKESFKSEMRSANAIDVENSKLGLSKEVQELRTSLDEMVTTKLEKKLKVFNSQINTKFDRVNSEILRLEYFKIELEREKWVRDKVYINALRASKNLVGIASHLDRWVLESALDLLVEDLNQMIDAKSSTLDSSMIKDIGYVLDNLTDDHAMIVSSCKEKVSLLAGRI